MIFGWHVVVLGTLCLWEVNVPQSFPLISILALFGTHVCDAVRGIMSDFGLAMLVGALKVCLAWVNGLDTLCGGG